MAQELLPVSSSVLAWARNQLALTVEEVAEFFGCEVDRVRAWEAGDIEASSMPYGKLERLADDLFKLPVAVFFLPAPPAGIDVRPEFRTLPDAERLRIAPDTRSAIRAARGFQVSLEEIHRGHNPAARLIWNEIRLQADLAAVVSSADRIRRYLGVEIEEQMGWSTSSAALEQWRERIQDCGVFVFKRSFSQNTISGFSLPNEAFPVVMLNNSHSFNRQIFTLFHELAHVLMGVEGATSTAPFDPVLFENPEERRVEEFCNSVAAECLLPNAVFWEQAHEQADIEEVERLADLFCVSREAVYRRYLDRRLVTRAQYLAMAAQWNEERRSGGSSPGGNYYNTQMSYLGRRFVSDVFKGLFSGRYGEVEAAQHLGVKPKNLRGFQDRLLGALGN